MSRPATDFAIVGRPPQQRAAAAARSGAERASGVTVKYPITVIVQEIRNVQNNIRNIQKLTSME
jgi:hypothetical protein